MLIKKFRVEYTFRREGVEYVEAKDEKDAELKVLEKFSEDDDIIITWCKEIID